MSLKAREFASAEEVTNFLRGGLIGGKDLRAQKLYLDGKTLIFTSPASETVTFSGTNPLLPLTVVTQILAQTTGVDCRLVDGRLFLVETSVSGGVAITGAGTANADLGFGDADWAGTVYGNPGDAAPALVQVATGERVLVVTDE